MTTRTLAVGAKMTDEEILAASAKFFDGLPLPAMLTLTNTSPMPLVFPDFGKEVIAPGASFTAPHYDADAIRRVMSDAGDLAQSYGHESFVVFAAEVADVKKATKAANTEAQAA